MRCAFCRPILSTNSFVSVGNGIVEGTGPTSSLSLTGSGSEVSSVRVVQGQLILGDSCRVTDSQVSFNFQTVTVGDDCKVLRNRISGTGSSSSIDAGDRALIEDNHITSSDAGISAGAGALIRGNSVSATQGGIFSSSATVTDNVVDGIGFANTVGIGCDECVVEKNVVSDWGSFGLSDSSGATAYKGNHFDNNNGGNANPQVSGGLETGANVCGGNTTCP